MEWETHLRTTAPRDDVADNVRSALSRLLSDDIFILAANANERSISHRLAMYLEDEFPEWNVDCEYNRDGYDQKRLDLRPQTMSSDDTEGTTVYPDIIVHKRGTNDNLLVIEIKKTSGGAGDEDREKLRAFKGQLGYGFALFVRFDVNERAGSIDEIAWI